MRVATILLALFAVLSPLTANADKAVVRNDRGTRALFLPMADSMFSYLSSNSSHIGKIRVEKVVTDGDRIDIHFNRYLAEFPIRDTTISRLKAIAAAMMPQAFAKCTTIGIHCDKLPLERLSSPFYSGRSAKIRKTQAVTPLVTRVSLPYGISKGLEGKHIAMWQSHGWYYDQTAERWEWQRARMFLTVEDLYTRSYVVPFLVPMLENAGANVLLPRERDSRMNEVIVDNDPGPLNNNDGYSEWTGRYAWDYTAEPGFSHTDSIYVYPQNPFRMGTARMVRCIEDEERQSVARWRPDIPQEGDYAVYVSYQTLPESAGDVRYTVNHSGGATEFRVNQKMGGGTWIYLGTFNFKSGRNADQGVTVSNLGSDPGAVVTCDAVKFGGGMGNIARKPSAVDADGRPKAVAYEVRERTSGYPRFAEGARYWLQWAGFEPEIYSVNNDLNDYNDDFQSRGLWVNALALGSYRLPRTEETSDAKGYNIPIDLSFALHSDAGTTPSDSIIGTLAIYTRMREGSPTLPDGTDRVISRELCDLVQTQIIGDVQSLFEPLWTRRGLWNRSYAESRYPQVPAMILELLSHQNFADMRYGLDPAFRFTVSRAIYKGILRFLCTTGGTDYVVQPLPVKDMVATTYSRRGVTCAQLKWNPTDDPLEPSAKACGYVVYCARDDGGFDNGALVEDNFYETEIEPGIIYSFKVVAVNEGGASFPSETLSVGQALNGNGTVLVVNGFDRVSAPASYATRDTTRAGFLTSIDAGIPYICDLLYTGAIHEERRSMPWTDDDAPGFGASDGDMETKAIAGNTFDFPLRHGRAFLENGMSFVSTSRSAVEKGMVSMNDFQMVDIILGKQLTTMVGRPGASELRYRVFTAGLQKAISAYLNDGGRLVLSGSNIATDIWDNVFGYDIDSTMTAGIIEPSKKFATEVLHWKWMTNKAGRTGLVRAQDSPAGFTGDFTFASQMNDRIYQVDAPDGIVPQGRNAYTIFRYADTNISAGVAYDGKDYKVVSLGFPIETIENEEKLNELVGQICSFLQR